MEPDPIAFAWRAARALHLAAAGLAALAALLLGGAVPVLVTRLLAAGGVAPGGGIDAWIEGALGASMRGPGAAVAGLAVTVVLAGLAGLASLRLGAAAAARAAERLRDLAAQAVAGAAAGGRDDVRALAALVGAALRSGRRSLGAGIALPAFAGAASLLALAAALLAGPWSRPWPALAALVGLGAVLATQARARERGAHAAALHGAEDGATERAVAELAGRLPALRAHGTAAFERRRLDAAAGARRASAHAAEDRAALARALALAALAGAGLAPPAAALWTDPAGAPAAAAALAAALAPALAALPALARLRSARRAAAPVYEELARVVGALRARRAAEREAPALPAAGEVVLEGVAAYDPGSGERVSGIDLAFALPAHVALVGERGGGARALAQLLAGQAEPTAGRATLAGIDLAAADPVLRAKRLAFAGGEPILVPGTLRQNLLYGTRAADEADAERRLIEALTVTGLDRLVYARGLTGPVGAAPALAGVLVAARAAVRERLAAEGAAGLVDPFDRERYGRHATIGENLLFGVPVGDTFAAERLAGHAFLRAVLEAEDLTGALTELGLAVARGLVEIFADLPDDHPLFDRFSLFPAGQRGYFEDIVARRADGRRGRRGAAGASERESLIGLALRYNENRHRLGLVDPDLEARIVSARRTFAALLPPRLATAIEFYDPGRIVAAASLQDNLLFGRVASEEAGAEGRVRDLVRGVLSQSGLDEAVYRVGLAGAVGTRGGDGALTAVELAAIDLARCLVRRPDILVVENALDELGPREAAAVVARLRGSFAGRGLILRLPGEPAGPPFDLVLRVDRGALVDARTPALPAPEAVPA